MYCDYAVQHEIVFNCIKIVGAVFSLKTINSNTSCIPQWRTCEVHHTIQNFCVLLYTQPKDDNDNQRQAKSLQLRSKQAQVHLHKVLCCS